MACYLSEHASIFLLYFQHASIFLLYFPITRIDAVKGIKELFFLVLPLSQKVAQFLMNLATNLHHTLDVQHALGWPQICPAPCPE